MLGFENERNWCNVRQHPLFYQKEYLFPGDALADLVSRIRAALPHGKVSNEILDKRGVNKMKRIFRRLGFGVLTLLLVDCAQIPPVPEKGERFTFVVDEAIKPSQTELPGLNGGPVRSVGVIVGPDGRRDEFVINEVILHPRSAEELNAFLVKYGGTILRDGTPLLLPETELEGAPSQSSGWYLIRVDLNLSSLDDLASNMEDGGLGGQFLFSSEDAVRLAALLVD